MNRPRIRLLGLFGLGGLLSQAGHLLAYQIQFGAAAETIQSQGAHAYFPALAKTSLGVLGAGVLGGLLVMGVARVLPSRPAWVVGGGPSLLSLLSVLFTIQLACFIVQETIEALVAGTGHPALLMLVMIGSVGQLPVAALAALALKWIAVRFEEAVVTLGSGSPLVWDGEAPLAVIVVRPTLTPVPALAETCPTAYVKRGPPTFLRA